MTQAYGISVSSAKACFCRNWSSDTAGQSGRDECAMLQEGGDVCARNDIGIDKTSRQGLCLTVPA